jgi:drug/metabolite transporter (DMT)-like permease
MTVKTTIKALLSVLFWGASFVATKAALAEISPLAVIVLRFAIGLAVIVAVLARRRQLALPKSEDLGWLALLGAIGITFHQMLQANGLVTTTATNSAWIVALIPIFTAILARVLVGEPFGLLKTTGLGLATIGTLLVIGRGSLTPRLFRVATIGDGLVLVSAANWALFTALSKRLIGRYTPGVMIAYITAFGWLLMLPLLAWNGGWPRVLPFSAAGWASVLFLGVFCSGLAYVYWYDALAETDASALTAFIYLEPIVTLILAAALIGEAITWPVVLGGGTILCGVWLVNRDSRQ